MIQLTMGLAASFLALSSSASVGSLPSDPSTKAARDGDVWTQAELERVTAEIQKEIEEMRGLSFKRPVAVELSDKAGFLAHATQRMEEMTPEGKMDGDQDIARHLGMIPHDMDLLQVTMDLLADQVGGFYSPASQTFYLMPSFTGDLARVILAHELTHALDDQHFNLDEGFKKTLGSTDASTAYAAIVEGSGTQLMTRWLIRHLSDISSDALQEAGKVSAGSMDAAPPYLWLPLIGVYTQGQAFLDSGYAHDKKLAKEDGRKADINASLDRAFAAPPRSSEQVLHPEKYWDSALIDEPQGIQHGALDGSSGMPDGWSELQRDVLGELQLGILTMPFEEREVPDMTSAAGVLGLRFTNAASTGWGGDEVLLLGRGNARLVHLITSWDTPEDAQEFLTAVLRLEPDLRKNLLAIGGGDAAASGMTLGFGARPDQVLLCVWSGASVAEAERVVNALVIEAPAH